MDSEYYMRLALEYALEAAAVGEVPVGCIIVDAEENIIGYGRNRCEEKQNAVSHAEMEAIDMACRKVGKWQLSGCSLFVTLEPCPMCAGAIINSRIAKVFYGAKEPESGSCGSIINLFMERYGHKPQIVGGILEKECSYVMKTFFEKIRKTKKS